MRRAVGRLFGGSNGLIGGTVLSLVAATGCSSRVGIGTGDGVGGIAGGVASAAGAGGTPASGGRNALPGEGGTGSTGYGGALGLGGAIVFPSRGGAPGLGGSAAAQGGHGALGLGGSIVVPGRGGAFGLGGSTTAHGGTTGDPTGPLLETSSKLDLLFVIDNSLGMELKLPRFRHAALAFLQRLVQPRCVGPAASAEVPLGTACPAGTQRERTPVSDLHVGVITTDLGSHGGETCSQGDDKGHLIATVRPGIDSYAGLGFAKWDPAQAANPPGLSDSTAFIAQVGSMLEGVNVGCGYEASLEAWYRFLVDPEPPALVESQGTAKGLDSDIVVQRAAFLRPDSAVSIVLVSDENDCSITDDSQGWLITSQFHMPKSTSVCETNPNDPCCTSCAAASPPEGCASPLSDFACRGGLQYTSPADPLNLRCWDQKRRFGFDFLYPISRYVDALTKPTILDRGLEVSQNQLFVGDARGHRSPKLVSFTTLVGVPWQDIAVPGAGALTLQTAAELAQNERWNVLIGDNGVPADPFMRESIAPRSGVNPITQDPILPPTEPNPVGNAINGHELALPRGDFLETACTFALETPVDCDGAGCDCGAFSEPETALCQASAGEPAGTTQYRTGATPGLRQLGVQSQIGSSAVVGTICIKDTAASATESGYAPSFEALSRKVAEMVP